MSTQAILIIEDDPAWQAIFREIVADCGFKPAVVAGYHAALSALAGQTFALAIVDISLSAPDYADRSG
ncbi:MAG: response regulator, partial [Chloroflexota bacterium]